VISLISKSISSHDPASVNDESPLSAKRLGRYKHDSPQSSLTPYQAGSERSFATKQAYPQPKTPLKLSHPFSRVSTEIITPLPKVFKHSPSRGPETVNRTEPLRVASRRTTPRFSFKKAPPNLEEYLEETADQTPTSTTSREALPNTSSLYSRGSLLDPSSDRLSEDFDGLLYLAPSVVIDDRPRFSVPADPDLSPTQGWSKVRDSIARRRGNHPSR
jgi:hypothetical protein